MPDYPLPVNGKQAPRAGWTGVGADAAALDGGSGPGYGQAYVQPAPEGIWEWITSKTTKAVDELGDHLLMATERADGVVRWLERCTTWSQLHAVATAILGPDCFAFGIACGIAESLKDMVGDLVGLLKMFLLAGMYEVGFPTFPGTFLEKDMADADADVRTLVNELTVIMKDPVKFLGAAWKTSKAEYIAKWNEYLRLRKEHGLHAQFDSGRLVGEVMAEVVTTILGFLSGVAAVARGAELTVAATKAVTTAGKELLTLSEQAPELVRIARGLKAASSSPAGDIAEGGASAAKSSSSAGAAPMAAAAKFVTGPNEAFFWSGRSNGIGGARVAAKYASSGGGTTLEQLIESRGIQMPDWDPNNPASIKAWQDASRQYAQGASGTVRAVIGSDMRPGNIWETVERDALMQNPSVDKIIQIDPATGAQTVIFSR